MLHDENVPRTEMLHVQWLSLLVGLLNIFKKETALQMFYPKLQDKMPVAPDENVLNVCSIQECTPMQSNIWEECC